MVRASSSRGTYEWRFFVSFLSTGGLGEQRNCAGGRREKFKAKPLSSITHLRTTVQAVKQVSLTRTSKPGDDVGEIKWFAVGVRDRNVQNVFERLSRADFRAVDLLLQVLVVADNLLHAVVVVVVIVGVVSVAKRRGWRCLLVVVLIVDIKLVSFAVYHFVDVLHRLRRSRRCRRVFVLSRSEDVNDGFHGTDAWQGHVLENRQVVFGGISKRK